MSRRQPPLNTLSGFRFALPVAGLMAALMAPALGHAATYNVNNAGDEPGASCPSDCTLRAAIRAANASQGEDTILLGALDITLTIPGTGENSATSGDLDISDDLQIIGEKPGGQNIINAAGIDRAFHIHGSAIVEMQNISIRNGAVTDAPGGGIYVAGAGRIELNNVELRSNQVTLSGSVTSSDLEVSGGGLHVDLQATALLDSSEIIQNSAPSGGGISNTGRTEVLNSSITGNTATGAGGPGSAIRFSNGGGISNLGGYLAIGSSTVANNVSDNQGGGLYIINQGLNLGLVTITNSAISGNESLFNGAGIANFGPATLNNSVVANNVINSGATNGGNGAGIFNNAANASMDMVNATVSGNSGAYSGGGIFNTHDMTLTNVTVYDNHALPCASGCDAINSEIGGNQLTLFSTSASNLPNLILANTLIANGANSNPNEPACAGSTGLIQSIGNNLSDDASCNLGDAGDLTNVTTLGLDPDLTTTTDLGGTTLEHTAVHALLADSPAIDSGADDVCPLVDQRFFLRDENCDIGAYEFGATQQQASIYVDLKAVIKDSPDPAPPNKPESPLTYVVTITNQYVDVSANGVVVSVTLPASYEFSRVSAVSTGSTPRCDDPNSQNVLTCTIENLPGLGRAEFFISGIPRQQGTISASVNVFSTTPEAFPRNNNDSEDTVIDPEAGDPTNFGGTSGAGAGGGMLHPAALLLLSVIALRRRRA